MANAIDILIAARWRGSPATKRAAQDLRGMSDAAASSSDELKRAGTVSQRTGRDLKGLVTTLGATSLALGGVYFAGRRAFNLLEESAGLDLTRRRFDRLAESIGTSGNAFRSDLREATRGTLSQFEAMSTATDILALDLVTTADDAARLTRVVSALGADMNEVVLALTNQSVRRFDQIGVSVEGFEDRLKSLEAQGLSTQAAFTQAFLAQGEAQIEKVGDVADTSAGKLAILEAKAKDAGDSIKLNLLEGIEPTLDVMIEQIQLEEDLQRAVNFGIISQREKQEIFRNGIAVAIDGTRITKEQVRAELEHKDALFEAADAEDKLRRAMEGTNVTAERQIDLAEEVAESWGRAQRALIRAAEELEGIERFEALREGRDPGGADLGQLAAEQRQEELDADFELQKDRVELWQDFQADITSIVEQEQARRLEIESQFEGRRTELIADYNERRAEIDAQLTEDIADTRADLQDDANRRLENLEKDHQRRRQEIIEDAEADLTEAASKLDAAAVSRIERQRDRALEREQQQFEDQRQEIQETLQRRIAEEVERLNELHDKRLEQEQKAHEKRLEELDKQEKERLDQLRRNARREEREREQRYIKERRRLGQHWDARFVLEQDRMQDILQLEEQWWQQRAALVPDGTTGTSGSGDTGSGGTAPSSQELVQIAVQQMQAAGWSGNAIYNQTRVMRSWTDSQIARWIERNFGYDVPGYRLGGSFFVGGSGGPDSQLVAFRASPGEQVTVTPQARAGQAGGSRTLNLHEGAIVINPSPGMDERAIGREFERRLTRLFERMA